MRNTFCKKIKIAGFYKSSKGDTYIPAEYDAEVITHGETTISVFLRDSKGSEFGFDLASFCKEVNDIGVKIKLITQHLES